MPRRYSKKRKSQSANGIIILITMIITIIVFVFTVLGHLIKFLIKLGSKKNELNNPFIEVQRVQCIPALPPKKVTYRTETTNDQSIIDVDQKPRPLQYETAPTLVKFKDRVPLWSHHYIYSANEINQANSDQRSFYAIYKKSFYDGTYIDLEGNTNYGFTLYFELLKGYESHKNLPLLEKQLKNLEISCPRTSSYAHTFLLGQMRELGDISGIDRLAGTGSNPGSQPQSYLQWDWRIIYEKKMNLTKDEVELLSFVWLSSSTFMNIEFCRKQVIRLYLEMIKALRVNYTDIGTNTEKQFAVVLDVIARKQHRYHLNSPNYKYVMTHDSELYMYILRYGENLLRDYYGNTRKINLETYYNHEEVKATLQERIFDHLEPKISHLIVGLDPLDEASEVDLNCCNPSRWRSRIAAAFNAKAMIEQLANVESLVRLNAKNPSLDLLLYQVCRQLLDIDKSNTLGYYFRHVKFTLDHKKVFKLLTATQLKKLFPAPEQSLRFHTYLNIFFKLPDLESALKFASDFYTPIRKQIILDPSLVQKAEVMDSQTSERLALYLNEVEVVEENHNPSESTTEVITASLTEVYLVTLTPVAVGVLRLFRENEFTLSNTATDAFCRAEGQMTGNVINNINEACYDLLDDLLIENNGTQYTINKDYYEQIID
jgi:hypothetical protein